MSLNGLPETWLLPDWPAPANVRAFVTTREGGISKGPYAAMNLGQHVDDGPERVAANRSALARILGKNTNEFCWLEQVHGKRVVEADPSKLPQADAVFTQQVDRVCAVMTADCLPVLLCDAAGQTVAAVHAGWRGLASGVIEATLERFEKPEQVIAWLGPAIGPAHFEVGSEVRAAFCDQDACAEACFVVQHDNKYLADLYELARQRLQRAGVKQVYGGGFCTYSDAERFYSYRRQGAASGRMASLIWLSAN